MIHDILTISKLLLRPWRKVKELIGTGTIDLEGPSITTEQIEFIKSDHWELVYSVAPIVLNVGYVIVATMCSKNTMQL